MAEKYDMLSIELEGSKLLEASAGTGKTYSIAIIVLRLILEKKIPIDKILMVTFTIAAVAELESRVRKFIRTAYRYAKGLGTSEKKIKELIGEPDPEKAELLRKAVQSLDNLSVMTIHSFCQKCITNNPFETNQSFECELSAGSVAIIESFVNEYWRKEINTIEDLEVFKHLKNAISVDSISEVVFKALDDKEYVCPTIDKSTVLELLRKSIKDCDAQYENYRNHCKANWVRISQKGDGNRYASGFLLKYNRSETFANEFLKKCYTKDGPPNYFGQYFTEELNLANGFIDAENEVKTLRDQYAHFTYSEIIDLLKKQIIDFKTIKNTISFDDLITGMHLAVRNGKINNVVLNQYEAVFIDEFQDTDIKQYEIFSRIFNQRKILFYIGDPKQSIYCFRKADINTYKKARESASVQLMNENFRSTEGLIKALNNYFAIENPFHDTDIEYEPVDKGGIELGEMTEEGSQIIPIAINEFPNNEAINEFVKNEILRLLKDENILIKGERIQPSDIAVLTRTNIQANSIKKTLSSVNIPTVTIDGSSVLESPESLVILTLLSVVLNPDNGGINKVLLNGNFGFKHTDIESLDTNFHLAVFRELKNILRDTGIYNMLFRFYDTYQLRKHCLEKGKTGQRALSNFYQLAEILHQVAVKTRYSPEELMTWLQRERTKTSEEYEQRIESEENAVQILTIHKSKGLTFKIVFAPFLDLKIKEDVSLFEFRDDDGYKFTHQPDERQMELYRTQSEQENRRLIYVAMTRAQYKVYVCDNKNFKESSLKPFLNRSNSLFEINVVKESAVRNYQPQSEEPMFAPKDTPQIEIKNTFGIHSFSSLSSAHHSAPFEKTDLSAQSQYDQFIFQVLSRGANVGTALHSIFERLNFTDSGSYGQTIEESSKYYRNILKEEYLDQFAVLVNHVMHTEIDCSGQKLRLSEVANEQKLPEMEFCFSLDMVNKADINALLGEDARLGGDSYIEGLMNGFVDLIFEHKGKYYILDWKSNHLGNSTEKYNREGMNEAMKANNYNFQYLIYTVAVKRWLEKKIEGFDYEKHFGGVIYVFLRGVREGSETGIYTVLPEKKELELLDNALTNK